MNVYLMVDIEGISGIYAREQVLPEEPRFQEGRRLMTADINACMRGLKEAGVSQIYVHDCHGGGYSVLYEEISSDADYVVCGQVGNRRFAGIEDCDAVILLGYHAKAGEKGAILEHTMNSKKVQNMQINGVNVGEFGIDAGIAGDLGKPVIMVSGDDKVCNEARRLIPGVVTAQVKKGLTSFGGMLLPCEKAHALIREKAKEAVEAYERIKPLQYKKPIEFCVELTERTQLPNQMTYPHMTYVDGRTFKVTADTVEEALFRARAY